MKNIGKIKIFCYTVLFWTLVLFAAPPAGYYSPASGLSGNALRAVLHDIIDGHSVLSYTPGVWNAFATTDLKPNGKIWDMYSSYEYTLYDDQAGNYSAEGDVYNREHSWPQSYFNEASPMVTDLFHIYPTDGYVNGWRSNYPYGETNTPTRTSTNGSKLGPARSGLGYSGTVFEPIDEYKGDFARTYFYMATRYYGEDGSWSDWAMADGVELKAWAVAMLLQWNQEDPVSEKELNRNDAIYNLHQHNRNPFIDHPEYAEYIWGGETPGTLDAPLALAATEIDSLSFTANWTAVNTAAAYHLYVAGDENFETPRSVYNPKSVSGTSELIGGLHPGTDYYYKVKAVNDSLESPFSNVISVRTLAHISGPADTVFTYTETFDNFPESGSSYQNGSFTGENGLLWTYQQCRGDIGLEGKSPCLAKTSLEASLTSGTISGGIASLSFQYMQAFSTDVSLDLFVNGQLIRTFTSSSEQNVVKESGPVALNVEGDAVISLKQNNSGAGQVAIDNISWNNYPETALQILPEDFSVSAAYPNPFNPECTVDLRLRQSAQIRANLYDSSGKFRKQIFYGQMSAGEQQLQIRAGELPSGLYLLHLQSGNTQNIRKLLLIR
ncbi:MAG: endonuclease [Candidatus Marinimicrobia bacterium]|nr:endonuclease [Candidatus Neomarinimicrobiota bacterium]